MILEQEHIINKIFLEVTTNSTTVAHNLKDNLGMFLKEDILPYLEDYFKSIEQKLPADIVQIPKLTLEVKVNSQSNFKDLKTDTKEKLVQKIDAILKTPSQVTEEVILINTEEHQTRSLLFFIENGYNPWWKTSGDQYHFTLKEIKEIASSHSFSNRYIQLLQKPISKKRSIQQFTDQELQILLKASFKHSKEIQILHKDFIKLLKPLSTITRDFIWHEMITYLQSKNVMVFIEKFSSVLIKSISSKDEGLYAFAKAVLAITQQALKITKLDTVAVLQKKTTNASQNSETLASKLITIYTTVGLSEEANMILQAISQGNVTPPKIPKHLKNQEIKEQEENITDATDTTIGRKNTTLDQNHISNQEHTSITKETEDINKTILDNAIVNSKTSTNSSQESTENSIQSKEIESEIFQKEGEQKEITANQIGTVNSVSKKNIEQQYNEYVAQHSQVSKVIPNTIETHIKESSSKQEEVFLSDTGTYHVPNAGLIIVHPYLKPFFDNCGILDDTNTITDPEIAVHALHYLATKKEQQLESQMLFEKFLCGIPLKTPIQRQIQLSDSIKQQAEELLASVIENWGVLHNASIDLLRHEFLQRTGRLSFKEDNPKIIIERKTQDILVDKLPWGIGICRLPWLERLVYTNW